MIGHLLQWADVIFPTWTNLVGIVLFFVSLWSSKGAAIAFLSRFAARGFGRHWKAVYATLGLVGFWGITCVIAMTAQCGSSSTNYYYDFAAYTGTCLDQVYIKWTENTSVWLTCSSIHSGN